MLPVTTIMERTKMGATVSRAQVGTREERAKIRAWLLKQILTNAGAWTREARVLLALAEQRGIMLDERALMHSDVREVREWQTRLGGR